MSNIHKNFNSRTRVGATAWRIRFEYQTCNKGLAPTWCKNRMRPGLIKGNFSVKLHFSIAYSMRRIPGNFLWAWGWRKRSIRCGIILENLSYFTSEPACTQFGSLMLTVLFYCVQKHLPHSFTKPGIHLPENRNIRIYIHALLPP